MTTEHSLSRITPDAWPEGWQPVSADGLLIEPCGCTMEIDADGFDVFPYSFCSDKCEAAWHLEDERECRRTEFDELVFGSLMTELGRFRPVADILIAPLVDAPHSMETREAATEEMKLLVTHLLDTLGCAPWFPWLAEQADERGDLRLPWPLFAGAALQRNEHVAELRPHGLDLVDNVRADPEAYVAALLASHVTDF
ncbi:hypothetical protein [Tomitella gaofuii]|uniref:hypothetical protein n=1 Tax=Tomitella gaofuii TaxID=2760083 RepID=UPI0015F8E444|nr:hypothetical protein [Tomitella gaofuii]